MSNYERLLTYFHRVLHWKQTSRIIHTKTAWGRIYTWGVIMSDRPFPLVGRRFLHQRLPWFPLSHLPGQRKLTLGLRANTYTQSLTNASDITFVYSNTCLHLKNISEGVGRMQTKLTWKITSSIWPPLIFFSSFSTSGSWPDTFYD